MSDTGKIVSLIKSLGGSGGGGLPTGGEPHQMLVTDVEGNAQWEDKLCYETFEDVTFLAEQTFTLDENGTGVILEFLATPSAGDVCVVSWNGVEYECEAKNVSAGGIDVVALGNASDFGGEPSADPFAITVIPADLVGMLGCAGQFVEFDGSQSVVLSITGKKNVVKKIDPKFVEIKGETVFLDIVVSNDWSRLITSYPYAALEAFFAAGKNLVMKVRTANDEEGNYAFFMPMCAKDSDGIYFQGFNQDTGAKYTIAFTADDGRYLQIGSQELTLISSDGTAWWINVSNEGTASIGQDMGGEYSFMDSYARKQIEQLSEIVTEETLTLNSPNGTKFIISVSDTGELTAQPTS